MVEQNESRSSPSGLRPEAENLFLLGVISQKVDGVMVAQEAARKESAEFRTEVRGELDGVKNQLNDVDTRVSLVESRQGPKTAWYNAVFAITSIVATAISLWLVFARR